MKAGILTFHRALNYGAVLQTFALNRAVCSLGAECKVIDYRSEPLEDTYKVFNFKKGNPLIVIAKGILKGRIILKKKKGFDAFVAKNISITENSYSFPQLSSLNDEYDLFITGSDQVWSPSCVGFDEAYFLTFAENSKKNSYAASIGCKNIPSDKVDKYLDRLKDYKNISVREKNAAELLRGVGINLPIEKNIDPTLLLSSEEYDAIAAEPAEKKYILVFSVNMPVNLLNYAKKLGAEKGLQVIYLNDKPMMRVKGITYKTGVSPEQFLGYIKNAEYVVTNSFHGTAFSVIFHKNFFVEYQTQNGRNGRAEELLDRLGISNREIKNLDLIHETPIDWEKVEKEISAEREKSYEYLKKILGSYHE